MFDLTLLEFVLLSGGVLVCMTLLFCLCCLCMKYSDYRMKKYVIELAKSKGIEVDTKKLERKKCQSPLANENCAIYVPDVGIIL